MSSVQQRSSVSQVRVGILHSQSGTMALSERPTIDATLMAIAEINQGGGILGQIVEPVIVDGASDAAEFERQARKLLQHQGVTTVFGCWTSATRKAVKPIFESGKALLWYPVQYEGLESSPYIFYSGSCPNQQVEPAVIWLLQHHRKRFFLVGSDYVFPRTAHKLIRAQLKQQGGEIVAENYVELGASDFTAIIALIAQLQPDVVFNTLNGDSNTAFYRQYREAGLTAETIPILAVSVAEAELQSIGEAAVGHYASWSYFQSLDTVENQTFVRNFRSRYGSERVTSDPIEAAYFQVYLWKQAVETAQSFAVERVRAAAIGQSFAAPGGPVKIEPNHHVWKHCYIGRVVPGGQFETVWSSQRPIKPLPWLGVEELNFSKVQAAMDLLAEVSEGIQQTWLNEQKSRELEILNAKLQQEVRERQLAEMALAESQRTLSTLMKNLPGMAYRFLNDEGGTVLFMSEGCYSLTGYSVEDFTIHRLTAYNRLIHPDDRAMVRTAIQRALDAHTSFEMTYRISTATEELKWVWEQGQGIFNADDSLLYLEGFITDITARISAEEAFRASEERWELALRGTGDGIFDWDIPTGRAFASRRLIEMLGYQDGELSDSFKTWRSLVHPEDRERTLEAIRAHLHRQTPQYIVEHRLRCKDGRYKWVLARGQAQWDGAGNPVRMVGSHQDISDRKAVQEELQLLLETSQAISAAPDFDTALEVALERLCETTGWVYGEAWSPTDDWSVLECNPRWYSQLSQLEPDTAAALLQFREYSEVLSFLPDEGIPGKVWSSRESLWVSQLNEIDDVLLRLEIAIECGFKAAFGVPIAAARDWHLGDESASSFSSPSSVLAVLVFFTLDSRLEDQRWRELVKAVATQLGTVLQQKKVQAEMKALFAAMTDVVTVRDVAGRCLNAIPTNAASLYKPIEELVGRKLHDDLPLAQADLILNSIKQAIFNQKTVTLEYSLTIGERQVWFVDTISPLSNETAILVARDISDRKMAEEALRREQQKSDQLLLNILPEPIANQLKQERHAIAEQFNEVTILFADIVGFTPLSARLSPIELVGLLNEIFSTFDALAEKLGLEKIKTIGDAYMVAAGLPLPRDDHAEAAAQMALEMQAAIARFQTQYGEQIQLRIGINVGVVVAGVIGTKKFIYDLWGDAVNVASRMESSGEPGKIQVNAATYERLKHGYSFKKRGYIPIKGKGKMMTYWLVGSRSGFN
jgi:urea ABC transporter urea binding protein